MANMDPCELRMNLASIQRIDPYIEGIIMSSPQVAIYKYSQEWEETEIEGTLFVYERKCEPCYGFLVLNRLSSNNLIQPITKDIELQDKTPFLLYKTKEIHGIWFYESGNCQKLYSMMSSVIEKLKNASKKEISDKATSKQSAPGVKVGGSGRIANSNNGEISLADLLHNAGNKEKPQNNTNNHEASPSGGEKLLRLLSVSEQNPDEENKENGGGSVAAFFAQVSQASSTGSGPPPPGLPAGGPRMDPMKSLFTDPAVVSVEALENQPPPMPVAAKAASDLESNMKPNKTKKTGHGANKTPNKNKPAKPEKSTDSGVISCASVAAAADLIPTQVQRRPPKEGTRPVASETQVQRRPPNEGTIPVAAPPQPQPQPPTEKTAPQLMSPMVFAGTAGQDHQSSPGPVLHPNPVPVIPPPAMPLNGVPLHLPVQLPQVTPLTEAQLMQAFQHLLRTDRGFISKLHQAYVESLNTQLH